MTQEQKTELEYLIDLLREASKWNVDQGDDALRLEVDLRINNILNSVEVEDENEMQCEPEVSTVLNEYDHNALEETRVNEHLASPGKVDEARKKWEKDKIRVYIDGKHVWKKRSECVKQPRDNSKGGPAWKWIWLGPQDKKAQEDAMWAEHDKGE